MEVLPAPVRQHPLPTALQYRGQPGGGQVHRRERPGSRGEQLRNYVNLHRIRIRLQHGMLRRRLPALRRERLRQTEDRRVHGMPFQRHALRPADACRHLWVRPPAASDPHARGGVRGLQALPGHLHMGTALCLLLQYLHRHLLRPGGLQDALLLPGGVLHLQHRGGHPVRKSL